MAGLKTTGAKAMAVVAQLMYRLRNLLTGRTPVHLVVCGPDDDSAGALMDLIPQLFSAKDVSVVWGQAIWAQNVRSRLIVSFDPDDAARAEVIDETLSPTRRVIFVLAVGDPRELVGDRSQALPHHFRQSADYRLHVDGRTRSMTQPGVISRSRNALEVAKTYGARAIIVRREDIRQHPHTVQQALSDVVRQHGGPLASPGQGVTSRLPNEHQEGTAGSSENQARVESQRAQFPELDEVAEALGYPSLPARGQSARVSPRGLIIAFHTPDEVYQAEANRLRKSLDALGLDYQISVVEPESNWVRTTLLKPTWIAPARKTLRGPLLYVDVDAYVHSDPWPFVADMEADMAAMVDASGQLYSGTLFIGDTIGAETILSEWVRGSKNRRDEDTGALGNTGDDGDQGVLKAIVEAEEATSTPRFSFGRLPPNLATIFDRSVDYQVGPIAIEHLQASRESTQQAKRLKRRRDRLSELSD
jgi:hypothetical protein